MWCHTQDEEEDIRTYTKCKNRGSGIDEISPENHNDDNKVQKVNVEKNRSTTTTSGKSPLCPRRGEEKGIIQSRATSAGPG